MHTNRLTFVIIKLEEMILFNLLVSVYVMMFEYVCSRNLSVKRSRETKKSYNKDCFTFKSQGNLCDHIVVDYLKGDFKWGLWLRPRIIVCTVLQPAYVHDKQLLSNLHLHTSGSTQVR